MILGASSIGDEKYIRIPDLTSDSHRLQPQSSIVWMVESNVPVDLYNGRDLQRKQNRILCI